MRKQDCLLEGTRQCFPSSISRDIARTRPFRRSDASIEKSPSITGFNDVDRAPEEANRQTAFVIASPDQAFRSKSRNASPTFSQSRSLRI
jgi:hypothetical protein